MDAQLNALEKDQNYLMITKDASLSKSCKRKKKEEYLIENYSYLLGTKAADLPPEHKASLGGGLRCFRLRFYVDKDGVKHYKKKKVRCKLPAVKGSFYCTKHNGGNSSNLVHGRDINPVLAAYKGTFGNELGDLITAFANDKNIFDIRPEFSTLRVALINYIKQLNSREVRNSKTLLRQVEQVMEDDTFSNSEKFFHIKEITDSVATLSDGESIDRLARTIETLSRIIERMHKIQSSDDYIMTPEGLRIFLRAISDVMNENIKDVEQRNKIHEALLAISIQTKGDLSRYSDRGAIDADYTIEKT